MSAAEGLAVLVALGRGLRTGAAEGRERGAALLAEAEAEAATAVADPSARIPVAPGETVRLGSAGVEALGGCVRWLWDVVDGRERLPRGFRAADAADALVGAEWLEALLGGLAALGRPATVESLLAGRVPDALAATLAVDLEVEMASATLPVDWPEGAP